MEEFKYLGTTFTNQNSIQEEIKSIFKSVNAYYQWCRIFCLPFCYPKTLKIKIYRTIILTVLYGYGTWSLTLRAECRLRVFENRMLRRISVPKRDEVTGEWKKLPIIVRVIKSRMGLAGHVTHMGEGSGVYRVLVGKPEGKRPLGRPRHRWEDNI